MRRATRLSPARLLVAWLAIVQQDGTERWQLLGRNWLGDDGALEAPAQDIDAFLDELAGGTLPTRRLEVEALRIGESVLLPNDGRLRR